MPGLRVAPSSGVEEVKNVPVIKIYEDADDKHVAAVKLFARSADHKLYLDEDYTVQADFELVENAFIKGRLFVVEGESLVRPSVMTGAAVDINGTEYAAAEM